MKRLSQSRPICKQTTFIVLLVWAVLTLWPALAQTAFASQEKLDKELNPAVTQTAFSYQGQLKENGVPATGTYDVQFVLYTAQTGGDELGSIVHEDMVLTNGLFRVELDFGRAAFDGNESWLEVAVRPGSNADAYTVLSPRQRLTPTPYAILAQEEWWSLIGVPVGFTGGVDVIKHSDSLKVGETLAAGSNMALAPNGTPNFVAKFDGSGNPTANSIMFDDGTNVGIGTPSPAHQVHILGPSGQQLFVENTANGQFAEIGFLGRTAGGDPLVGFTGVNETRGMFMFYQGDTRLAIDSSGNVGIGTTSPAVKLHVAGAVRATGFQRSSDARLKTNATPLTDVLEKLEQIRGVAFEWNELSVPLGHTPGQRDIGVIAQEVEAVFPELVASSGDDGYKTVDYGRLAAVLIEAIKELKAEVEQLRAESETLKQALRR